MDRSKPFSGLCLNCARLLGHLDRDPNGDENETCARCRAEEEHDFDAEPGVTFDRAGHRKAPPPPAEQASGELPAGVLNRDKTLEVLRQHNAWRRGGPGEQTDPRMLGLALDAAIAALSQRPVVGLDNPSDDTASLEGNWYCERHPEKLQGHDGCESAGIPACARIDMLAHQKRMLRQEIRERDQQYGFLAELAFALAGQQPTTGEQDAT